MDLTALTEPDETELIVGFFNLRGFAKWSENQQPRALFDFAVELFQRTGAHISDTGGYLVKSIGDDLRFDVYGATVNHAALMKGWPFSISQTLHAQLNEENQNIFHQQENGKIVN
jgi:class 3 adenylate cyclase